MLVAELIEQLEEMPEGAEVRLAIQPSWPFQHTIDGVVLVEPHPQPDRKHYANDEDGEWEYEDAMAAWEDDVDEEVVYIAEGGQYYRAPYLPGAASRVLGWK